MDRLCGRPGCSERASVAYGMRAEDLVFWLDRLPDVPDSIGGVLCRRHSDSMIVPRGWTLDDLRDPELHLFRPPTPLPPPARNQRPRGAPRRSDDPDVADIQQLELVADLTAPGVADRATAAPGVGDTADIAPDLHPDHRSVVGSDLGTDPGSWTPEFDEADDLDGLLSAHGPLLARAFRTADRPNHR